MSRLGLVVRGRPAPLREVVRRPGAPDLVQLDGLVFRGDARLYFISICRVVAGAGHALMVGQPRLMALAAISARRRAVRGSHGFDATLRRRKGSPGRSAAVARGRRSGLRWERELARSQTALGSPPSAREPSLEARDAAGRQTFPSQRRFYLPVSYTHLTLPTILLV